MILFVSSDSLASQLVEHGWVVEVTTVPGLDTGIATWTPPADRLCWLLERAAVLAARTASPAGEHLRKAIESMKVKG